MTKFREKINGNTFFVCSTYKDRRVHDCIKGWGKVSPSGKTVLWDSWRRPPKRKHYNPNPHDFGKLCLPVIRQILPECNLKDIFSVQPLGGK